MTTLYNSDCLEVMDNLIEQGVKVDMILTDPPYGTTACKWDSVIPFEPMWERINKLIKDNGCIALFGSEPFSSFLRVSNIKNYRYDWIWNKKKAGSGLLAKKQPLRIFENIMIFNSKIYNPQMMTGTRKRKEINKIINNGLAYGGKEIKRQYKNEEGLYYPKNIIEYPNTNQSGKFHPTQKPVDLLEYLIKTYTREGEMVLDFTMGSGSTGVACRNLDRNFIGIELDENYFKIAEKRINGAENEKA